MNPAVVDVCVKWPHLQLHDMELIGNCFQKHARAAMIFGSRCECSSVSCGTVVVSSRDYVSKSIPAVTRSSRICEDSLDRVLTGVTMPTEKHIVGVGVCALLAPWIDTELHAE